MLQQITFQFFRNYKLILYYMSDEILDLTHVTI